MSVLEGLMAGLMAGLMGAMTTVMMINDNITLFMPILIGSCLLITGGMSYMIYKESKDDRKSIASPDGYDMINYIAVMFIVAVAITFIMVLGPKSAIAI
jgi:predicted lipid-binding transport protein (Tim44 family)